MVEVVVEVEVVEVVDEVGVEEEEEEEEDVDVIPMVLSSVKQWTCSVELIRRISGGALV